jgi:hypothetical protein
MGVVPAHVPGPGKANTKIDKSNTHTDKPMKGMKLKPSRGKSTINSLVPSKVKGWHHRIVLGEVSCMKGWMFKESHMYKLKRCLNASSKSQASNKQDSLSLLSTNLVDNSSIWNYYDYPRDWHLLSNTLRSSR